MAPRSGARSCSRAPNAAIIDTAETAAAAGLADRNVLPSGYSGRRRYLWLAPNEGWASFVLDRRWHWPRCSCRVTFLPYPDGSLRWTKDERHRVTPEQLEKILDHSAPSAEALLKRIVAQTAPANSANTAPDDVAAVAVRREDGQ